MTYEQALERFATEQRLFEVDRRKLDRFARGYLEAVAFTDGASAADGDELADVDLMREGDGALGDGVLAAILADCNAFQLPAAAPCRPIGRQGVEMALGD